MRLLVSYIHTFAWAFLWGFFLFEPKPLIGVFGEDENLENSGNSLNISAQNNEDSFSGQAGISDQERLKIAVKLLFEVNSGKQLVKQALELWNQKDLNALSAMIKPAQVSKTDAVLLFSGLIAQEIPKGVGLERLFQLIPLVGDAQLQACCLLLVRTGTP